ncbi:MAG: NAD-dependent epimerase/dehydratase family protein [Marinicaulis sp.]|nr:NAD-dependent epimerase/dehydratase family protein [Marinicaulis sp.]
MNSISVVTGGAGFVGKRLVEALRARGERVCSFDLAPPSHEGDVRGSIHDMAALSKAFEGAASVFHLAGNANLWSRNPHEFNKVNFEGTKTALAAARGSGVQKFVHCSSLTTLVGKNTPIGLSSADETVRLHPDDMLGPYPRSKLLAEFEVERAAAEGFDAVIAIPTEPLGEGDTSLTPPTKMILDFVNGKTPAYIDCILNFVSVDSLADGLVACRDKGERGERYLLGGENLPLAELLTMLSALTGRPMPKTKMPYAVALAAGAIDTRLVAALTGKPPKAPLTGVRLAGRQVSFSSVKAAHELGWRAGELKPALGELLDWALDNGLLKSV